MVKTSDKEIKLFRKVWRETGKSKLYTGYLQGENGRCYVSSQLALSNMDRLNIPGAAQLNLETMEQDTLLPLPRDAIMKVLEPGNITFGYVDFPDDFLKLLGSFSMPVNNRTQKERSTLSVILDPGKYTAVIDDGAMMSMTYSNMNFNGLYGKMKVPWNSLILSKPARLYIYPDNLHIPAMGSGLQVPGGKGFSAYIPVERAE